MPIEFSAVLPLAILFAAAVWAGAQNQLAGGGSFLTLPALMLTGLDARTANITSTVALFPGQITGGWYGRSLASGTPVLSLKALILISLAGGAAGGVLLLVTPSNFFAQLVPWLVLFATTAFAWGSFGPKLTAGESKVGRLGAGVLQFLIAVYGGYFGGGIGFLMLAALTIGGMTMRTAGATKNLLAGAMNFTAVLIFVFSGQVHWLAAAVACVGAMLGSIAGAQMLHRVNERALRISVIVIGVALTIGLFMRA